MTATLEVEVQAHLPDLFQDQLLLNLILHPEG